MATKSFVSSESISKFAEGVIKKNNIALDPATVDYLLVSPHVSKNSPGKITKANPVLAFYSDADYIIQISEDTWNAISDEDKEVFIVHLLERIYPVYNEKKDQWTMKLRGYDTVGFESTFDQYGTAWQNRIRQVMASIHDMDPEASANITFG